MIYWSFLRVLQGMVRSYLFSGNLAEDNRPPIEEEAEAILQTLGRNCRPCDSSQDPKLCI